MTVLLLSFGTTLLHLRPSNSFGWSTDRGYRPVYFFSIGTSPPLLVVLPAANWKISYISSSPAQELLKSGQCYGLCTPSQVFRCRIFGPIRCSEITPRRFDLLLLRAFFGTFGRRGIGRPLIMWRPRREVCYVASSMIYVCGYFELRTPLVKLHFAAGVIVLSM